MQHQLDTELSPPLSLAIMSITAPYAEQILSGNKQIELRRTPVRFPTGMRVMIYHTLPVGAIIGSFTVAGVVQDTPENFWKRYSSLCGISEQDYKAYFADAQTAYGVLIENPKRWTMPLPLGSLRQIYPAFTPPQRYLYLRPTHPAYSPLSAHLATT
jgi:predicted transcriptional regulator